MTSVYQVDLIVYFFVGKFVFLFFFPLAITINIQETIFINITVVVIWCYSPPVYFLHLLKLGNNYFSFDKVRDNDTTSAIIPFINVFSIALVSHSSA